MHKITPFLWFDGQAEEAARFYTSVFKKAKMGTLTHYPAASPAPEGSVMTATFELDGLEFVALNAGPHFKFTEAVSFVVNCADQNEVDYYWNALTEGGQESQCGWLKDKFGLSWQIVPTELPEILSNDDPEKAQRAMAAMMQMKKIEIDVIKKAAA